MVNIYIYIYILLRMNLIQIKRKISIMDKLNSKDE